MSNGSERTPERCVHAVDGPDWAGLRELNNAEVDYKALVEGAREYVDALVGGESANWVHLVQHADFLADAVEALLAENEKHRADLHEWETVGAPAWVAAKDAQLAEAWAERDALQARLDAMTVEWGFALPGTDGFETPDRETAEGFVRDFPEEEYSLVQRLVGPWTVVPEGDTNA